MLDRLNANGFEIKFLSHAAAILEKDFPSALDELDQALSDLTVPITQIIALGGGETKALRGCGTLCPTLAGRNLSL